MVPMDKWSPCKNGRRISGSPQPVPLDKRNILGTIWLKWLVTVYPEGPIVGDQMSGDHMHLGPNVGTKFPGPNVRVAYAFGTKCVTPKRCMYFYFFNNSLEPVIEKCKIFSLFGITVLLGVPLMTRKTKQWQNIGFQGDDPKTDFRGMGLLGLKNLL